MMAFSLLVMYSLVVDLFFIYTTLAMDLAIDDPPVFSISSAMGQEQLWGPYSPYFTAGSYQPPPNHCSLIQVSLKAYRL
jgi:hypothetical protein